MKITNVHILNWDPPGHEWWKKVEQNPDEPLIEANLTMVLSGNEYRELLARSRDIENLPVT